MILHVLIAMVASEILVSQNTHWLTLRERISHVGGPLADAGESQSATNTARDWPPQTHHRPARLRPVPKTITILSTLRQVPTGARC